MKKIIVGTTPTIKYTFSQVATDTLTIPGSQIRKVSDDIIEAAAASKWTIKGS